MTNWIFIGLTSLLELLTWYVLSKLSYMNLVINEVFPTERIKKHHYNDIAVNKSPIISKIKTITTLYSIFNLTENAINKIKPGTLFTVRASLIIFIIRTCSQQLTIYCDLLTLIQPYGGYPFQGDSLPYSPTPLLTPYRFHDSFPRQGDFRDLAMCHGIHRKAGGHLADDSRIDFSLSLSHSLTLSLSLSPTHTHTQRPASLLLHFSWRVRLSVANPNRLG